MIRKRKFYVKPRKAYERARIDEENILLKKYALKNKREIWKTIALINYYRRRAKALAKSPLEEQESFFAVLRNIGLNVNSIADALDLKVENLLERRLPTIVAKKNIAPTIKRARQMVVHNKILVNENVVNIPSYIVKVSEEKSITCKDVRSNKKENKIENQEKENE